MLHPTKNEEGDIVDIHTLDGFLHLALVGWKLAFAIIPPPHVANGYDSVTSIFSVHWNSNFLFRSKSLYCTSLSPAKLSRLIIINNSHCCLGIFSWKLLVCIGIVELNMEVFIWFPTVIIKDWHVNALCACVCKFDDCVHFSVIFSSNGFGILRSYSHRPWTFRLLRNDDL